MKCSLLSCAVPVISVYAMGHICRTESSVDMPEGRISCVVYVRIPPYNTTGLAYLTWMMESSWFDAFHE